jgi:hypothetical protein
MVGAVLVILLALPIYETVVVRWSGAMVAKTGERPRVAGARMKLAGANPAGAARALAGTSGSPGETKPHDRTKVAALKKCGAADFKGACGQTEPASANHTLPKHDGKGVVTHPANAEPPRQAAQGPGHRPSSTG